jgi:predicted DNA binding CopG/RHH family protein
MNKTTYLQIRMTPYFKRQLKSEAALKGVPLSRYIVMILRARKHSKKAILMQEVISSER